MKRMDAGLTIVYGFMAGLLGTSVMLICFLHPVNIRTVDVTTLISEFVAFQASEHKSPDALKNLSLEFSHALEEQLNVLAKAEHVMIMPKEAILAGSQDMTPKIRQALIPYLTHQRVTHE